MAVIPTTDQLPAAVPKKKRPGGNPWQRQIHSEYLDAHHNWATEMERHTGGYATEEAEYRQHTPPPRFKEFLQGRASARNEDDYNYHMGL